jgi:aspartyl-tRNA synthetase
MEKNKRTFTCGDLRKADAGKTVTLNGWVHRKRSHGGILFVDLRDRYGITQIVVDENSPEPLRAAADELKYEYCVAVVGTVRPRPDSMVNPQMSTGEIEVAAGEIEILTRCEVLPFMIDERADAKEDLRMRYRYLDLRTASMQRKMRLRHDVVFRTREYLNTQGFYEIETPTLIKSTPEGARDFLVPSRVHPGKFYALPQSPQLYKQILMVSGLDKYFQIARCYRDEDARGDRQLEFTQIDIEMSFVSKDDVFALVEGMMKHIFRHTMEIDLPTPFPRLAFEDAMNLYGSDKPELRFGWEMKDFSPFVKDGGFQAFKSVLEDSKDGTVKALVAKGCGEFSRKQISELEETAKTYGAKGLAWMKATANGLEGGVSKFYEGVAAEIVRTLGAEPGDLILMVADRWKTACTALGAVRTRLGRDLKLYDEKAFSFAWIVDFPLFEYNEEERRWEASHHMFTMPQERYLETLESDPGSVKGDLYDLVCNGYELASGSIRIHDPALQQRIFDIVGFEREEAERRFGFLLEAFRYGAPPHGGIAPGLDRLIMIMAGEGSIREVIAFPKNTFGVSPMDDCPSIVDQRQLDELHLKVVLEPSPEKT